MTESGDGVEIHQKVVQAKDVPLANGVLGGMTIYADLIRGGAVFGEIAKFNLAEYRMGEDGNLVAIHVGTIIIPRSQVAEWGAYFSRMAEQHDKATAVAPPVSGQ